MKIFDNSTCTMQIMSKLNNFEMYVINILNFIVLDIYVHKLLFISLCFFYQYFYSYFKKKNM